MGASCLRNQVIVNSVNVDALQNPKKKILFKLQPSKSSVYELNEESIYDIYTFKDKISKGYYGKVFKACYKSNPDKLYAIKTIEKTYLSPKNLKNLVTEIQILAKLDHPNIVKYYETYDDSTFFHIVMELCEGGELAKRIKNLGHLEESEAAVIMFKLLHAISHCHSRGIVHRDLKAENVLFLNNDFSRSEIKIIDFGLARRKKENLFHSIVGTPLYVSPEILNGEYNNKCDIWSLGVILYYALYGRYPFEGNNKTVVFHKIKGEEPDYNTKGRPKISNEGIDLIKLMLLKNSSSRPNAIDLLNHKWFGIYLKDDFKKVKLTLEIIPRLKYIQRMPNKFIKIILGFIVKEISKDNEICDKIEDLNTNFYNLDLDKDGLIDLSKIDVPSAIVRTTNINNMNSMNYNSGSNEDDESKMDNSYGDKYSTNKPTRKNSDSANGNENFNVDTCKNLMPDEIKDNFNFNYNNKINYTEFIVINLKYEKKINKEMIYQAFCRFADEEDKKVINVNSFYKNIKRTGKVIGEHDVENILFEAGFKDPNEIYYEEFFNIVSEFLWN